MTLYKNEHTCDKEAFDTLSREFFAKLPRVRRTLNYILCVCLYAMGIFNFFNKDDPKGTGWGIALTVCASLLLILTVLYPLISKHSLEKYSVGFEPYEMSVEFKEDSFKCSYCQDENLYSDIKEMKETDKFYLLLIKNGSAIIRKGSFTVGNESEFADFLKEKTGKKLYKSKG